jgi:hypothetical protein
MRLTGREIVNAWNNAYDKNWYAWNGLIPAAETDLRMYLGDQWHDEEKRRLMQEGRSPKVYNFIRPKINMVSGYQKKYRHGSVVVPTESQDQNLADQLTKLLIHVMQFGDGYECISDCFKGALITGWNLLSIWKDYRTDPLNGTIRMMRIPFNGFICDPYFSKKDFSDCADIERRNYISLEQAKSLLPEFRKDIDSLYKIGWERDNKFNWLPYQQQPNGQRMLAYDEFWVQGWEEKKYLYNVMTGDTFEYEGEASEYFLYADPNIEVIERVDPYVDQHVIVNGEYITTQRNPYELNEYPFVPFFAIFEPESSDYTMKVQSLVRTMIDPQKDANRRRMQMIDIVESQINSGWMAEEDSVVNPQSLYQTSQGKVIWKKPGLNPGALERLQAAQIPPTFFDLNSLHDNDIGSVANITDELLGQADNDQDSGLKVMLRQGAALVGLQDVFDNLRFAQEIVSRKVIKMIMKWSPEKMKRIMNEEPDPRMNGIDVSKYDIAIQEGVLTNSQQQLFFRQMLDIKAIEPDAVPPGFLAKIAPLQGKTEYMQAVQEYNEQQQQAQEQQAQIQNQQMQVQGELIQSQSIANIASAKERFTRAVANMGLEDERASKSVDNRADAVLKRMKAAAELDAMTDEKLMKYLSIFMQLEQVNAAEERILKSDDVSISADVANQQQNQEVSNAEEI